MGMQYPLRISRLMSSGGAATSRRAEVSKLVLQTPDCLRDISRLLGQATNQFSFTPVDKTDAPLGH